MKLTEYKKLQRLEKQIERQKKATINEILNLLAENTGQNPTASSINSFSFLKIIKSSHIIRWDYDYHIHEQYLDQALNNLKAVLETSKDLRLTLSRIVQYENMKNVSYRQGNLTFFLKVRKEWTEIISNYLGSDLIIDRRVCKRNINPKNS